MRSRAAALLSIVAATALVASSAPAALAAPPTPAPVPVAPPVGEVSGRGLEVAADGEVPGLRTATSRTFVAEEDAGADADADAGAGVGRALEARVYAGPVNFRDGDGVWRKIDNRLVAGESGVVRNAANAYRVQLPPDLSGPVTITTGEASVSFSLVGAKGGRAVDGNQATYAAALPQVDVRYTVRDAEVKEDLVLHDATAPSAYTFTVTTSRGLRLAPAADGGVDVVDGTGAVRMVFAPPTAVDAAGVAAPPQAVAFEVAGDDLRLLVDEAWLTAPDRVFPVTVDPTTRAFGSTQQTMISAANPAANYASAADLQVGNDPAGQPLRVLAQFDVRAAVPPNVMLLGTSIQVGAVVGSAGGNVPVGVYQVTRPWTSAATWNTYDGLNSWTAAGGDIATTNAGSATSDGAYDTENMRSYEDEATWLNSALVHGWYDGTIANNGLMLKVPAGESAAGAVSWPNTDALYLSVDYTGRTGDRPFYSYESRPITDQATLKVNVGGGNLLLANDDLHIAGPGMALQVQRFYNSLSTAPLYAGPFGADRWQQTLGYDVRMSSYSDGMMFTGPSGYVAWFAEDAANERYISPPGINADLAWDRETMTFHESGTVLHFGDYWLLESVEDRNGNRITVNHEQPLQADSQVTSIVDTAGRTVSFTYNTAGLLASMTDAAGRVWLYGYDTTNTYLTSYTDPTAATTVYDYAGGRLSGITDPRGNTTRLTYDGHGRVTGIADPGGSCTTSPASGCTRYAYTDPTGPTGTGTTVSTDARGHTTTYTWDSTGKVTAVEDALGRTRSTSYTANFDVASATDALSPGNVTTISFDSQNRPTGTQLPTGAASSLAYAPSSSCASTDSGHPYQPKCTTDAQGNTALISYDGPGNVTSVADSSSGGTGATPITYTYNPPAGSTPTCGGKPGQRCTATDGNGNTTDYEYDGAGNLVQVSPPAPLGAVTMTYDAVGRMTSRTDGEGQTTSYAYDDNDRITEVLGDDSTSCAAGTRACYTYDGNGNRTTMTDATGVTTYGYDARNRQTSKQLPGGQTLSVTYDAVGNTTSSTDAGGTTNYGYDQANQLIWLAEPGGSCTAAPTVDCTTFGYDDNAVRTSTTYPGGTVMQLTPDNSGRTQSITGKTAGGAVLTSHSYSYQGPAGDTALVQSMTDTAGAATSYGYDSLGRLTTASLGGGSPQTWAYAYDDAGNRTSAATGGVTTSYGYNAANQLTSRNGSTSGWAYDANGNETAGLGTTTRTDAAYSPLDQLTDLTSNGTATSYDYADTTNRERVTAGNTSFQHGPLGLTTQTTTGTTSTFIRDPSGTLIAYRTGGASYYYLFDRLGSVVGLVDSTGALVNSYSYDPYGAPRTATEQVPQPYRYTSGYLDPTGLYHLQARYYDPSLGRFTQPDPSGQENNAYLYAGGNPCNNVDPTGLDYEACIVLGGYGSLALAAYSNPFTAPYAALFTPEIVIGGAILALACATQAIFEYFVGD